MSTKPTDNITALSQPSIIESNGLELQPLHSVITSIQALNAPTEGASPSLKELDLKSKSGGIWECIDRKFDEKSGGYIYYFRIREGMNDLPALKARNAFDSCPTTPEEKTVSDQRGALFPAIENYAREIIFLDPNEQETWITYFKSKNWNAEEKIKKILTSVPLLNQLGYSCESKADGVILYLPDQRVLTFRWQQLRETHPTLPEFHLTPSEGVATHMAFIEAFLSSVGVLSNGKEFVHDHQFHIIPAIQLMLDSEYSFAEYKQQVKNWIQGACDLVNEKKKELQPDSDELKKYELIEAGLGALIDNLSAFNTFATGLNAMKKSVSISMFELLATSSWKTYFIENLGFTHNTLIQTLQSLLGKEIHL